MELLNIGMRAAKIVHKGAKHDVAGVLNDVDKVAEAATEKRSTARHIHSLARAPALYYQDLQIGAAQSITSAARFKATEPIFRALDSVLKCDRRACSDDYVGKKVLKHRTSQRVGKIVQRTKEMKPGREGMLGAGIYFAESEESIHRKTRSARAQDDDYAMITADVDLGRCRIVSTGEREWRMLCDGGYKVDQLKEQGFDSVGSNFNGGWEYVVFDPKLVEVRDVAFRQGAAGSGGRVVRR